MDFSFSEEEIALRKEVQQFIREQINDDVLRELKHERDTGEVLPRAQAFFEAIHAKGWFALSWPKELGGQGMSHMAQYIVEEEFYRVTELRIGAVGSGAPAIVVSGTPEQKAYYLPKVTCRENEPQAPVGTIYGDRHCKGKPIPSGERLNLAF